MKLFSENGVRVPAPSRVGVLSLVLIVLELLVRFNLGVLGLPTIAGNVSSAEESNSLRTSRNAA